MKVDTIKLITTKIITVLLLVGAYFALVDNQFQLSDLVVGAIISWVTLALNSEYSDQASTRNARQQQTAFDAGVSTPMPTVTTSAGPPASVTVTPNSAPVPPAEVGRG